MLLTGDMRLRNVVDAKEPFALIDDMLQEDDVVFGNLEGMLHDEIDPNLFYYKIRWTNAGTSGSPALRAGNFKCVGLANNVTMGAQAIKGTIEILDGMGIAHTGAGMDLAEARRPAIVESKGVKYGFLQRTSIFWPTHHKALPSGPVKLPENLRYVHGTVVPGETVEFHGAAGVATIAARTAYEPSPEAMYEGGGDAIIHSWADPFELQEFVDDVKKLRPLVDVLVTSHHWRLIGWDIARDFRAEIAHAAIDAGADLVIAHGTHVLDGIEVYKGKVIFYGLGELIYRRGEMKEAIPREDIGHAPQGVWRAGSLVSGANRPWQKWYSIVAKVDMNGRAAERVSFTFVTPKPGDDRPIVTRLTANSDEVEYVKALSAQYGTSLRADGDSVVVVRD